MSGEMVRAPVSAPSRGALIMADALQQEAQQRQLLGQYVAHHMTEGTDFGIIPGTKNKTLLKPGAEKLTQLFRCIPRFVVEDKIENWETGHFHYRFSCQIVTQDDGTVVAEGVGSCSTYESRYRWRTADRVCPMCGKEAILRSKYPPKNDHQAEPGWYCFAKKNGCGTNFDANDPRIIEQRGGRVQNPDIIDQVNTVLKMAKKRALVDASIALARCSDIFTQDVEDLADTSASAMPQTSQAPNASPSWSKEEFRVLLELKGRTWNDAIRDIDTKHQTDYVANRTAFEGVRSEHIASYTQWLAKQPDMPRPAESAPEGKQSPDPTGSARSAAPPAAGSTTSQTWSSTAPRTDSPKIGGELVGRILEALSTIGVDWPSVRNDRVDAELKPGYGIAAVCGFAPNHDLKCGDLTPAQGTALWAILQRRVAEKQARSRSREKAGAEA